MSERTFPVIEIFGPTIQGEGALIGQQTAFVRFGGCDYRCSWCDTLYAVLPEQVRVNSTPMTAEEIIGTVVFCGRPGQWVTLSGGNPLLLELDDLVSTLQAAGYRVTAETQGSVFKPWAHGLDLLTVSPKPPSSGMATDLAKLHRFLAVPRTAWKVVVFDDADYAYARDIHRFVASRHPSFFLQVGNAVGQDEVPALLDKLRWLTDKVLADPEMADVGVLPQLHVLLWGNKRGV